MDLISKETITNLIESCNGMAVSIYMPTYVSAREARQNPVRLKNLTDQAEEKLQQAGLNENEVKDYLAPLFDLIDDEIFWQEQDEGLALFLDEDELRIFHLPKRFDELTIVGPAFHITPLIPIYKGSGPFYLLALDQKEPKIYTGSKYKLVQIEDLDLPDSLQKMFNEFYEFHSHLQFHTKTATPNPDVADGREGMYFGRGGDDIDENAEIRNYFHRFDEALMDFLDGEGAPLVLAGLGYLHPLYREANTYPNLLDEGITKDIDPLSAEELHDESWAMVQEKYETNVNKAKGVYQKLQDKDGDTTDNINTIVSGAHFKRVHSLFVAENEHVWGQFNSEENEVILTEEKQPESQDLLNYAATHTFINGGNVLVLPKEDIPGEKPAAAILRF